MNAPLLKTHDPDVRLVEPNVERDAPLGVGWLAGEAGRQTLKQMGVTDEDNTPTILEQEQERVRSFIEREGQLNWMIEVAGKIVGAVWVDVEPSGHLASPALHIMIGDPAVRGRGVGDAATRAVVEYLRGRGFDAVYSRRLVANAAAARLLERNGFVSLGEPYKDSDGLKWQNVRLALTK